MIKTILLDIDNTIMDFDECARLAIKQACADFDMPFDDSINIAYRQINKTLWQQIESGILTRQDMYQIRWQMIFDKLGIKRDGKSFEPLFLSNLAKQSALIGGAKEILQYLKPKYTLCVASNAPYEQQLQRLQNAGIKQFFDEFFISEKIGHQKPTKGFFEFCFDRLGNPQKQDVMIIGDSLTADISGGKSYGIKTCWFDRYGSKQNVDADFCIDKLEQLKNIL